MFCFKDTLLLILCLVILPFDLSSQTQPVQIKNIDFFFEPIENELIITYDLVNSSPMELYEVELSFIDGMNVVIRPKSMVGDIGKDIQGGENKRIIWNIFDDVESLSETAHPLLQIISINDKPIDPDLAIIINQINLKEEQKHHFKMQRDGLLIGGVGCGIGAVVCNLKANQFIEDQNQAENLEDYNLAGDRAQTYYTMSYVLYGVSAVSVSYALYQYIWGGKSKNEKTSLIISPGINNGFYLSVRRSF